MLKYIEPYVWLSSVNVHLRPQPPFFLWYYAWGNQQFYERTFHEKLHGYLWAFSFLWNGAKKDGESLDLERGGVFDKLQHQHCDFIERLKLNYFLVKCKKLPLKFEAWIYYLSPICRKMCKLQTKRYLYSMLSIRLLFVEKIAFCMQHLWSFHSRRWNLLGIFLEGIFVQCAKCEANNVRCIRWMDFAK